MLGAHRKPYLAWSKVLLILQLGRIVDPPTLGTHDWSSPTTATGKEELQNISVVLEQEKVEHMNRVWNYV